MRLVEVDETGEHGAVGAGGTEGDLVGPRHLQVKVRRMLPGHADAAKDLHGLLSGMAPDVAAIRRRDAGGNRHVLSAAIAAARNVQSPRRTRLGV